MKTGFTQLMPLTEEQLNQLPQTPGKRIVRFMAVTDPLKPKHSLKSVNLCTGYVYGGNVIHQIVYWDRPTEFIDMALGFLRKNNPGVTIKVIDSE